MWHSNLKCLSPIQSSKIRQLENLENLNNNPLSKIANSIRNTPYNQKPPKSTFTINTAAFVSPELSNLRTSIGPTLRTATIPLSHKTAPKTATAPRTTTIYNSRHPTPQNLQNS